MKRFWMLGLMLSSAGVWAQSPTEPALTLDAAVQRVARAHPDLRLIDGQQAVQQARVEGASLRPPVTLGATVENALGSGAYRGVDRAEVTVSLAGILERGGKLDARRTLVLANIDRLAPQRELTRLDLLAETARRYLAVTVAIGEAQIAQADIAQRKRAVAAATQRLQAGASPQSVVLAAEAAQAEAELDRDRAAQSERSARLSLASLWNGRDSAQGLISGDPLVLAEPGSFETLSAELEKNPELALLAGEARIREADLRLAQSAASPDLTWNVGVRRLQDSSDTALVGGISLPLGASQRAGPEIRAAQAELAMMPTEREALEIRLYSTLSQAHGEYEVARLEVIRIGKDILPRLVSAEQSAERAWRAGAISYLEWSQLQAQTIQARRRQLQAAVAAQTALIELQRLTGQPLVSSQIGQNQDLPTP